tara:strand:+ start:136 stop:246 length:111 start_codon:yes stop_codon:yes gene_type:complete
MKINIREPQPPKITITSKNSIVIKKKDDRIIVIKTV